MKSLLTMCCLLFGLQAHGQFIELEDMPRSDDEISAARSVRDTTPAPNSWVGSAAQSMAKTMAESADKPHGRCFMVKDENWKNHCLGHFEGRDSCFMVKDEDLRNHCLALAESRNACFMVKNENLRNHCLGNFEGQSSCHMIKNGDLKNHCLARFSGDDSCHQVRDDDLKNHCLAVRQ